LPVIIIVHPSKLTRLSYTRTGSRRYFPVFGFGPAAGAVIQGQHAAALPAGLAAGVDGAAFLSPGSPMTGSSSGPERPRPPGRQPSHAGPFCTMRVSALTV
jgi:hypothetical protein